MKPQARKLLLKTGKFTLKSVWWLLVTSLKIFLWVFAASANDEREEEIKHAMNVYGCGEESLSPDTLTPYDEK